MTQAHSILIYNTTKAYKTSIFNVLYALKRFFPTQPFHILVFLVTFMLPQKNFAQYRYKKFTYIGLDMGIKGDILQISDSGTEVYQKGVFHNSLPGIFVEQELNRWFSLNSGIYFSKNSADFRFHRDNGFNVFPNMKTTLIPLRASFNIPIVYAIPEIRIVPSVGINMVFNRTDALLKTQGRIAPDLSDNYTAYFNYNLKKQYILLEGGLCLDMMFAKGLILSFGGRYNYGFKDIAQTKIDYQISKVNYHSTLTSQGSFYNIRFGVKYPISRIWHHKRKVNS